MTLNAHNIKSHKDVSSSPLSPLLIPTINNLPIELLIILIESPSINKNSMINRSPVLLLFKVILQIEHPWLIIYESFMSVNASNYSSIFYYRFHYSHNISIGTIVDFINPAIFIYFYYSFYLKRFKRVAFTRLFLLIFFYIFF